MQISFDQLDCEFAVVTIPVDREIRLNMLGGSSCVSVGMDLADAQSQRNPMRGVL